jgi:methionyl-tRNA formyltransferase
MRNKMHKVVFFGTSDRSIPILEALSSSSDFKVALCVTKSDTKVGRKQELRETEVKTWAKQHKVKYVETNSLKNDAQRVIEQILGSKIDVGVVADFSFIIPAELLDVVPHKLVNIHFSLLPKWRGASPVQFAILNGDEVTGITYHLVDKKMDTGPIIHQIGYKIDHTETSGELYSRLFPIAAEKLPSVLVKYIDGSTNFVEQNDDEATYTYSPSHPGSTFVYKEDAKIDWTKSPAEIERAIRAYNPWPISWTTLGELQETTWGKKDKDHEKSSKKVKIYKSRVAEGKLKIEFLQVEGKKPTEWESFVNGYSPSI